MGWFDGSIAQHGLFFAPDQAQQGVRGFDSRERGGGQAPRLVLGYEPPPPATASMTTVPRGCDATYKIGDSFSVRYTVNGPPAVGASQVVDERIAPRAVMQSIGPLNWERADLGAGTLRVQNADRPSDPPLATCAVTITEDAPSPPLPGSAYDFGDLRIWADSWSVAGSGPSAWVFVARGNVRLGSRSLDRVYLRTDAELHVPASTNPATNISFFGTAIFETLGAGSVPFEASTFRVDRQCRMTGTLAGDLPVLDSSSLKLAVRDAAARVQLCPGTERPGMAAQGTLELELPENRGASALRVPMSVSVREQAGGAWLWSGMATAEAAFRIAGGAARADASAVRLDGDGLTISNFALSLPNVYAAEIRVARLEIDLDGNVTLTDPSGSAEATLPDWSLGGEVGIRARSIRARLGVDGEDWALDLTACVEARLPSSPDWTEVVPGCAVAVRIAGGELTAELPGARLPAAGRDLELPAGRIERIPGEGPTAYRWVVDGATLDLSGDWGGEAKIDLRRTAVQTIAPYLTVEGGGAEIALDETFALGGGATEDAAVAFGLERLRIEATDSTLAIEIEITLVLRVGAESFAAMRLRLENGALTTTGKAERLDARLAGSDLSLEQVEYAEGALRVETARLDLPAGWLGSGGETSASVEGLKVDSSGLVIDGATVRVPDLRLGEAIALSAIEGRLEREPSGELILRLDACVAIEPPVGGLGSATFVAGDCTAGLVVRDGRLEELTLPDFEIALEGLPLRFVGPRLASRDGGGHRITADEVRLALPEEVGSVEVALNDVELLDTAPYLVVGGATGRVPIDLEVGFGGEAGGAVITLRLTTLDFEVSDSAVAVSFMGELVVRVGRVTMVRLTLDVRDGSFELSASVPSIVVEVGGLPLRLEDVTLDEGVLRAARAALDLPDDWVGDAARLEGVSIDRDGLSIEGASFTLADQDFGFLRLSNMTGGLVDADPGAVPRRFRVDLSGRVSVLADTVVETGGVLHFHPDGKIDGELDDFSVNFVGFGLKVSGAGFDRDRVVAERAELELPEELVGLSGRTAAELTGLVIDGDGVHISGGGFSPVSGKVGKGDGRKTYTPIWPRGVDPLAMPEGPHAAAAGLVEAARMRSDAGRTGVAAPDLVTPHGGFLLGNVADALVVEYLPEGLGLDAPTPTFTTPDGTVLRPTPDDQDDDHNARFYLLEGPAPGAWTVDVADGVYVLVLGSDPAPVVEASAVEGDGPFRIAWEVGYGTIEGPVVYLHARSAAPGGAVEVIADGLGPVGTVEWSPSRLPAGDYAIEMVVDDGFQTLVHVVGEISWSDDDPPGAPRDLRLSALADGSLRAEWSPPEALDVAGYELVVGTGTPFRRYGRERTDFSLRGFNPGDSATLRLAAFDRSGNIGAAAEAEVTWEALEPPIQGLLPAEADPRVAPGGLEVVAWFRAPREVAELSVEGPGGLLLEGEWEPMGSMGSMGSTGSDGSRGATRMVDFTASAALGARWSASAPMDAPGRYVARLRTLDEAGAPAELSWSWTVVAAVEAAESEVRRLYLPHVSRTGARSLAGPGVAGPGVVGVGR